MKQTNLNILSDKDLQSICGGAASNPEDPGRFGRDRSAWIAAHGSPGAILSSRVNTNAQINIDYMNRVCGMSIPADPQSS